MTNAPPSLAPVLHDIHVNVVSAEDASLGVAEFWSGDRLIEFTYIEDGDRILRIEPSPDGVVLGAPWPKPSRRPTASSPPTEHTKGTK